MILEVNLFVPVFLVACRSAVLYLILVVTKSPDRVALVYLVTSSSKPYLVSKSKLSLLGSLSSRDRLAHDAGIFVDVLRSFSIITDSGAKCVWSREVSDKPRVWWAS